MYNPVVIFFALFRREAEREVEEHNLLQQENYATQTIKAARSQLKFEQSNRERAIQYKIEQAQARAATNRLKVICHG